MLFARWRSAAVAAESGPAKGPSKAFSELAVAERRLDVAHGVLALMAGVVILSADMLAALRALSAIDMDDMDVCRLTSMSGMLSA